MTRSRELGIVFGDAAPGPLDAITDVAGVCVGSVTLHEGEDVRTGVTVIVPSEADVGEHQLFAGCHTLNGNGELTGLEWVRESGRLTTPIALTNTHSVGVVRDALVAASVRARGENEWLYWVLPVVGETWDGMLNDINGQHVRPEHVDEALSKASGGPVEEGAVGSGTGMICHGFKGGIGSASRVIGGEHGGFTVGVLVQTNHGWRERLTVAGVPVGRMIGHDVVPDPYEDLPDSAAGAGSIIVIVATDAPLLPHQCRRLAQRASLGIARTGGAGEHSSGDILFAFSSARQSLPPSEIDDGSEPVTVPITMFVDSHINPLYHATVEATEAAIVNALLAAETTTGRRGATAYGLEPERLLEAMRQFGSV
ncbi:MAG TPA: P1 family peptidase [Solirubrobacteraceae bacterium]|nr:P1 family peptidase [Solirubrobacteraceae bacterium]